MCNPGSRPGSGQGCQTRVAKQVKHLDGSFRLLDQICCPVPMAGLFRKDAQVPASGKPGDKLERPIAHLPFRRHGAVHVPVTAALFLSGLESGVSRPPRFLSQCWRPHGLRLWSDEQIGAIALKLQPVSAIHQLVICPGCRGEDGQCGLCVWHGFVFHLRRW